MGVVDLAAVYRAHRRWPELDALIRRMDAIQQRLATPPVLPSPPQVERSIDLQAEAERMQAALRDEMAALEAQARQRFEAFAGEIKAEQEGRLADWHKQTNADLQRNIEARRDEAQRSLEKFELATMAEYRIPLLNLRVKADVVGITNEDEARRLTQEAERIAKERDEKIRARAQALEKTFLEYQQALTAEADAQLKAMIASLEKEATARLEARKAEEEAQLRAAAQEREATLRSAMEERRRALEGGTRKQLDAAATRFLRQAEAEAARLQAELETLMERRLRLEDAMLAEIKIEIAAVAQDRKVDVVLTHAIAAPTAVALTQAVIARLRRP